MSCHDLVAHLVLVLIFTCSDVPQSIYSLTEEHLDCFCVLAIIIKASINTHVPMRRLLCEHKFSTLLGKFQGMRLQD